MDLEITPDDLVAARLSNGNAMIDVLAFLYMTSRTATLRGMHIQGGGRNTMDLPPSFSGELVTLVLRLKGPLDQPISVVTRLRTAGLTLRAAHTLIDRLAEARLAVCEINEDADIPALAADPARMNVHTNRRRPLDPGLIPDVRARHGLSQREFSMLGIDIDTLRNWEQGRNKPDQAALNLINAFDKSPATIEQAAFEAIA